MKTKENREYELQVLARSADENQICYANPSAYGLKCNIEKINESEGCAEYCLTVENEQATAFRGVLHCQAVVSCQNPKFLMPAFLYNRNRGDVEAYRDAEGNIAVFPRVSLVEKELPYSDYWMVCSNRLSHPVSALYDGGHIVAVAAEPMRDDNKFNGFSCKFGEEASSVGFTLGYENAPGVYISVGQGYRIERELTDSSSIVIEKAGKISANFRVYEFEAENELGWNQVIRDVYAVYHQAVRTGSGYKETVRDIAEAIFNDAYVQGMNNYSTRVFLKDGKAVQEPLGSISWTGGAEVAVPELYVAARLSNQKMREQACTVIRHIVEHSLNEKSGLPFDAYDEGRWYTEGWWDSFLKESGHSSYLVGQALYYVLLAYEIEKSYFKTEHENWLAWVKQVLKHIETTKDSAGEVPHIWSAEDGNGIDYDSFSGCWCVAAAAYYSKITGDMKGLESTKKSVRHYYQAYVSKMECYGTPHDTLKAVDSEGSLAFVKACKILHEITGEKEFLTMLTDGMEYEFTFKFCWNPPIIYEPLKKLGWSSCGGSVTSTCNPHIHPMSNNVMDELLYCWEQTGDIYFRKRLKDTMQWGMQTYSQYDGQYDYGKKGWMSERFCYSEGLMIEEYDDGRLCSTWKCFLPWGASNIIEGFCGECWEYAEELECENC